ADLRNASDTQSGEPLSWLSVPWSLASRPDLAELEEHVALRDLRRAGRYLDVLLDPLADNPDGLIGTCLVLADGHAHPVLAHSDQRVRDKARHTTDQLLDRREVLPQLVEELGGTLPRIPPYHCVHVTPP